MRLVFAIILLIGVCTAWTTEDYEIFKLNDLIKQDLGPETTFYSWLGLTNGPSSTSSEIKKAYRKLSKVLHPDKLSSVSKKVKKQAEEKFSRLSLVADILSDQSRKRRYDYFYAKGFPRWKGTGYYYSKYRPGLITTIIFIYIFVGTFHYFALKINRKQDYKRIANIRNEIKAQAWGGSQVPPLDGSDRKLTSEASGKTFIVKSTGDVYVDTGNELHLINENEINLNPCFKDTLFFKLPAITYNASLGRFFTPIDLSVSFDKPQETIKEEAEHKKSKKKPKGKKMELANGKVVYSRKK
ncbi:hypothetical protein KGF56_001800 [Candida oxycetoniae]|uniref:J domain-containing protein n=1 Tax=Candida oxycetoniae TaxID=497107 RepID=A0AAI9SYS6_9ASCO|nr:uncharacterized protein KGF56_001800 [Candida oxycetoniae]KAI3405404.2 hypothetical protein KGF56_001800 [Candida oxycetoniae]